MRFFPRPRPRDWIAAALIALGVALASAEPAECVYCPTYPCYGPCGGGCACISPPGGGGGSCYGVEHVPALLEQGYEVVE